MEVFGICNPDYSNTKVLIKATDIKAFRHHIDFISSLDKHNIKVSNEYFHINNETIKSINGALRLAFDELFNLERDNLLYPKVDKTSKLFRLGYRESNFNLLNQPVFIYFASLNHKKLESLDNLIHNLDYAVEEKKIGFFYKLSKDVDKDIRPYLSYFIKKNGTNLKEALLDNNMIKEKFTIFVSSGLLNIRNQCFFTTHKFDTFYSSDNTILNS